MIETFKDLGSLSSFKAMFFKVWYPEQQHYLRNCSVSPKLSFLWAKSYL